MSVITKISSQFRSFHKALVLASFIAAMAVSVNASATPFANPDSANLNDDIDGSGWFTVGATSFQVELFDLADGFSEFGFFSLTDPTTLIPIFDASDATGSAAIINFQEGYVADFNDPSNPVVQSIFSSNPAVVGFYLAIQNFATFYSVPELNLGVDVMGAFESINSDDTSLLFYYQQVLLSWNVLGNISPYSVPVPTPLLLMLPALLILVRKPLYRPI